MIPKTQCSGHQPGLHASVLDSDVVSSRTSDLSHHTNNIWLNSAGEQYTWYIFRMTCIIIGHLNKKNSINWISKKIKRSDIARSFKIYTSATGICQSSRWAGPSIRGLIQCTVEYNQIRCKAFYNNFCFKF